MKKILFFAAVVEVGTGLALMFVPTLVAAVLLGAEISGAGTLLARCFGIALLALGLACWPSGPGLESGLPAVRAMLTYNALIALSLAYAGASGTWGGFLLWPAVVLHAAVAMALIWTGRGAARLSSNS